ncbi:MAG: hemerythrin domain-containing protein [Eubacteriales bacterium]
MNSIEIMVNEHKYIKRMLKVIRSICYSVMKNEKVDYDDFYKIIDFVRNYADKHHHGKEEIMLFNRMMEEIGPTAEKLIRHGMLVEHDLGRLYMQQLEEAVNKVQKGQDISRLDVIANAIGYCDLLTRHIEKEDGVVYTFAEKNLSLETMKKINEECEEFEKNAAQKEVQEKYIIVLDEMERKYL